MSLLVPRTNYKPFQYPWAFEAYKAQNQMHWLPEEVPLHDDVVDWNTKLSKEEKNLLTQIFRFFTQGDVDIAAGYIDKFLPVFQPPEVRMMLTSFAAMEAVHAHAYSLLLDTVGMPEAEYAAFTAYKEMAEKHDYFAGFDTKGSDKSKIAKTLATYSAFGEGLQLFSSFVILLNFSRFNRMKGMSQIVTWSIRDESLHVEGMIKLFRAFVDEHPEVVTDDFKKDIYDIAREMVRLEDNFIDLAFEQGGIQGLTPDEVKQYIRYVADRRLISLGLRGNFKVKDNPLPWLDWILNGVEHTNFFENRATEYAKGALSGSWADVWAND
ncbi:NrdF Ribonucleotide reductase, beta subunit [uncultured Caudovirales phage]|uniref:ribonucleoside-diphosphate reductase n=1 Tax=uncultured Caudovirales phage TaxID=2100421 RepID=A0A6J5MYT5_9CAUD|nr:NrdF Ribonucleotide reductase, beta subunit [uncultured Caudovirales phage]